MLTNRQRKNADRVAGLRLMVLWPTDLGLEPVDVKVGHLAAAQVWAQRYIADDVGIVLRRVTIESVRRPQQRQIAAPGETRLHIVLDLSSARWDGAPRFAAPMVGWA